MPPSIHTRDDYTVEVDGIKAVSVYRAFASEGKPFCLVLWGPPNLAFSIPTEPDGDESYDEALEYARTAAYKWADYLGELISKAGKYDAA